MSVEMGSMMSSLSNFFSPASQIQLRGRATPISPSGVRVCVEAVPLNDRVQSSRPPFSEICAISTRRHRRRACEDACHTACNALSRGRNTPRYSMSMWQRITRSRVKAICHRDCVPACDQPGRVAVSSFERTIGGPNGE